MNLEVRHLRLVRDVAASGSLTKASASLHLTQSALSHQLRTIESRLGVALFHRHGRRMALTPAGERLLRSAREALATLEQAEDAIRDMASSGRGVLRLTTECYTCYHWLPSLLTRYRTAHPGIEVQIDAAATGAPLPHLLAGRLDVAIVSDPVRDRRIQATTLFEDEVVVIAHPRHPLASKPFVRPDDFAGETLLTYSSREESTVCRRYLTPAGIAPIVQQVQLTEAMIELVKAGLGVAALARWAVEPFVRSGAVRAVSLTRSGFKRTWRAAALKHVAKVPHVKDFIDLVSTHPPFTRRAATSHGRRRAEADSR
jgi:LysR family transcriptional regulator, regulator for metE and metH